MSRIGKMPVPVPDAVKVVINGRTISAEGPKGKMQFSDSMYAMFHICSK